VFVSVPEIVTVSASVRVTVTEPEPLRAISSLTAEELVKRSAAPPVTVSKWCSYL
jgi:hypothetical protein